MNLTDDPVQQRLLRKAMEVFRRGDAGPVLREMSQEILAGRVSLREATQIPAYAEAVIEQGQDFRRQWDAMPDAEREALARQGEQRLAEEHTLMLIEREGGERA